MYWRPNDFRAQRRDTLLRKRQNSKRYRTTKEGEHRIHEAMEDLGGMVKGSIDLQ